MTSSQLVSCLWKWCCYFCSFVLLEKCCSSLFADCHCGRFQWQLFRGFEWKIPSCGNRITRSASLYGSGWRNYFSLPTCQTTSFLCAETKVKLSKVTPVESKKAKYQTQHFCRESDLTPFCFLISCCTHSKMSPHVHIQDSHICHQMNKESSWWHKFVTLCSFVVRWTDTVWPSFSCSW